MTYLTKRCVDDQYEPEERRDALRKLKTLFGPHSTVQVYIHYKGGIYMLLGSGKHTETEEELVSYSHLWPHQDTRWWFRPYAMFFGEVTASDGSRVLRFEQVDFDAV